MPTLNARGYDTQTRSNIETRASRTWEERKEQELEEKVKDEIRRAPLAQRSNNNIIISTTIQGLWAASGHGRDTLRMRGHFVDEWRVGRALEQARMGLWAKLETEPRHSMRHGGRFRLFIRCV